MDDSTQNSTTDQLPEERRTAPVGRSDEVRTVGPREGLAAGIIALGILAIAMPAVVDRMPSVAGGGSAAFVLSGMSVLIGIFVIVAGILSLRVRD